jgi:2,3-diketo-5-methylthio-1-phosphopentane phosphatase
MVFALDFDGTITDPDVTHILRDKFVPQEVADEIKRRAGGGMPPGREWLGAFAPYFPNDKEMLTRLVLQEVDFRPGFLEFVAWAKAKGYGLATISNGYGFYVDAMLESAGVTGIDVYRNDIVFGSPPEAVIGHPHPTCRVCPTCKVKCVEDLLTRYDKAVYVGDGLGDRFGAVRCDAIFARDKLASYCEEAGIPFIRWEDFYDIMAAVEKGLDLGRPGYQGLCPS